jgi:hypothetical protein
MWIDNGSAPVGNASRRVSESAGVYPEQRRPQPPQQWPPYHHPQGPSYDPPPGNPYPLLPPAPRRSRRGVWVGVSALIGLLVLFLAIAAANKPAGNSGSIPTVNAAPAADRSPAKTTPAKAITARDWAKIAKDPEGHQGDAVIVYGQVVQFDTVTGKNLFRANVDGVAHKAEYGYVDYDTNTLLDANGSDVGELVQGDLFKAEVIVDGSISYDTALGGKLTAPLLRITKITVTGSAK